jgi:hypothetical protein
VNRAILSIEFIKSLSVWEDFSGHYVFDGIKVRNNNNVFVILTEIFKKFLNLLNPSPNVEIALPETFKLHELDYLFLFFFIGKMDKVLEMLEVELLIFLVIIFDEPEISFLNQSIEIVFGESFLFMDDSFTDVRTVLNGFG